MRIIIVLLFICLLQQHATTQTSNPSQKEMQAQMQEAKREGQKQITELENQIAEAKIKEEAPDTIKEMEDRLALMKKMLGIMDDAVSASSTKPKTLPATKTVLPKYVSPIVPISLKQPVLVPTEAQAKDHLLWYRGKKIDANTLVTTKGMVIRYDRQGNRVIAKPDEKKDTTFAGIVKNLAKCRQWTDQYINKVAAETNSFFDYPQVMITIKDFDLIEKAYNNIVKNTIALPENTLGTAGSFNQVNRISRGPSPNFEMTYTDSTAHLKQLHQDLLNYMKEPRPPLDDWGILPEKQFELCSYCDPSLQEKHENLKKAWQQKFLEYEQELLEKMKAVAVVRTQLGVNVAASVIPGLEADINKAIQIAFERWDKKVTDLEYLHGKNIHTMDIVLENMLFIERQKKMYYGEDDERYKTRIENRMKIYLDLFINYFKGQMALKNYDVVFNTSLLRGTERHHKILGNISDPMDAIVRIQDLIDEVKAFNRFALTLSLDFRLEHNGNDNKYNLEADGEVSTEVTPKVYVSLGRLGDCGWQLYLTGTDYNGSIDEKQFRIPLKVKNGSKKIIEPHRSHTNFYDGPREILMVLPSFRISFCNGANKDSVILDVLSYKPEEDLSIYTIDDEHYNIDLLQHVNKMFISAVKTKDMAAKVTATAFEMINVSSQATVDKPTGYPKLDKMQVDYKMKGIQHAFQETLAETTHFQNPVIFFDAQNGKAVLLDVSIDIPNSELEGKYNLTKGTRTVKVEHDPQ